MTNPLIGIDPEAVADAYHARGLERLSDLSLLGHVCDRLHAPKGETSSFTLHAPLEALARYSLLEMAAPEARTAARIRLTHLAARYEALGNALNPAPTYDGPQSTTAALAVLRAAIAAGDMDAADSAMTWLAGATNPADILAGLTEFVFDYLGAAAHVPIYLYLAARSGPLAASLSLRAVRVYARQLAFEADARIQTQPDGPGGAWEAQPAAAFEASYWRAMATTPRLENASFNGIAPIVQETESAGLPHRLLAGGWRGAAETPETWNAALRGMVRAAADSMVQDTAAHAKLGWTHCLTIPQAVWAVAPMVRDPLAAVRFASVLTLAFRAGLGQHELSDTLDLPDPKLDISEALTADPQTAAASAYHAAGRDEDGLRTVLATGAAVRADTHLVKFTLAALDTARMDRKAAPVYYAGAAYLLSIWMREDESDPLLAELDAPGLPLGA
ncbi:hypothetical protein [Ferruginivarius sediminum]|uniref:Uncharacterized protein n=1 Tax=Ferruginivarius sediminum TaxID=2661937 RepID=A0A369T9A3_9PROT|nr:hypothetical protein [Ferruginivarius sediminum]RDD61893.1 hypothetical protein DRB17_10400 [Ferruginivarius sediminum]